MSLRELQRRLAALEGQSYGSYERLLAELDFNRPLIRGTPEYAAAVADPAKFRLKGRPVLDADEPGPEFPIL